MFGAENLSSLTLHIPLCEQAHYVMIRKYCLSKRFWNSLESFFPLKDDQNYISGWMIGDEKNTTTLLLKNV